MVWVSCQGATSADREYMGKVFYTPMQGYPGAYFPFLGQMGYQRWEYLALSQQVQCVARVFIFIALSFGFSSEIWPLEWSSMSTASCGPRTSNMTPTTRGWVGSTLSCWWTNVCLCCSLLLTLLPQDMISNCLLKALLTPSNDDVVI